MTDKHPTFVDILNALSGDMAAASGKGMSRSAALESNRCARCGADASPSTFRNDISRKEYTLTAWCQSCQDDFFGGE